jgi:AAHS family 3-hydroxyphenylpropionic acid transporter
MSERSGELAQSSPPGRSGPVLGRSAFILCFFVAITEGIDILSAGLAAPKISAEFGLTPSELGLIFSANSLGLFIGAVTGGWLGDRIGRGRTLFYSMVLLGCFAIATAFATGAISFISMRLAIGIGLGGALPNMIALAAEMGDPRTRATRVTAITAGMPVGSALLAGVLALAPTDMDWRMIFYVGGILPLFLALLIRSVFRAEPRAAAKEAVPNERTVATVDVLFRGGRAAPTTLLWTAFFFTLIVSYLLLNWLPMLLVGSGFSTFDAMIGSMIYSLGSIAGAPTLGYLYDRVSRLTVIISTYCGILLSLIGIALTPAMFTPTMIAIFFGGFFLVGSQFLLYGIATEPYPRHMRGRGVGSAVAVGRLGAIAGPVIAGSLLSTGQVPSQVLFAILPAIVIAFVAVVILLRGTSAQQSGASA